MSSAPSEVYPLTVLAKPAAAMTPTWESKFSRWVDLKTLSFSGRYRSEAAMTNFRFFDNGQQRSVVDGAFKIDEQDRYSVKFHVSSGRTFNWAYSDVINEDYLDRVPGAVASFSPSIQKNLVAAVLADPEGVKITSTIPSRGWQMAFRQLYFSASPIDALTFEFGGLGIDHGLNTEATSYDDDGYIVGERVRVKDPAHLYFDEISFTNAYEGDIFQPNFFERGGRFSEPNYRQLMVSRGFKERLKASADYTFDKGTHTIREAALVQLPEAKVIDAVRLELYQRLNDHTLDGATFYAHNGVTLTISKAVKKHVVLDLGYADIDRDYGVLTGSRLLTFAGFSANGDSYLTGNCIFTRANIALTQYLSLNGYYTHFVEPSPDGYIQLNRQGITAGMTFDMARALFPHKLVRPM